MRKWTIESVVQVTVEAETEEAACQQFDRALEAFDANIEGSVYTKGQECTQKVGPERGTPEWEEAKQHQCPQGEWWELHDGRGIYLCRVCDYCEEAKTSRYRPEILRPYTQADVDEDIEPDYGYGEERW